MCQMSKGVGGPPREGPLKGQKDQERSFQGLLVQVLSPMPLVHSEGTKGQFNVINVMDGAMYLEIVQPHPISRYPGS